MTLDSHSYPFVLEMKEGFGKIVDLVSETSFYLGHRGADLLHPGRGTHDVSTL